MTGALLLSCLYPPVFAIEHAFFLLTCEITELTDSYFSAEQIGWSTWILWRLQWTKSLLALIIIVKPWVQEINSPEHARAEPEDSINILPGLNIDIHVNKESNTIFLDAIGAEKPPRPLTSSTFLRMCNEGSAAGGRGSIVITATSRIHRHS